MLLKWEIYCPLLDFMTLVALLVYQQPQPFFFNHGNLLHMQNTSNRPPTPTPKLAVFIHFYTGDKGQINDVNINFHVFRCCWGVGGWGDSLQEHCVLLCVNSKW